MIDPHSPPVNTRLGFHYFPDSLHYREADLHTWLPILCALGASWVTLLTPLERAIPELFLRGLITAGIEPILHLNPSLSNPPCHADIDLLFRAYASWGVHYILLFDRPNSMHAWGPEAWSKDNLVERFLDIYLPISDIASQTGLVPVFTPLEPGGDFWDIAFLSLALEGIRRRGDPRLLERLVLSAYAQPDYKPVNWGAGGPERWPGAKPYITCNDTQDECGFRIFDWYLAIAQSVIGFAPQVILLGGIYQPADCLDFCIPVLDETIQAQQILSIAPGLTGGYLKTFSKNPTRTYLPDWADPIPAEVLACNFWLLSASSDSPHAHTAWFQPDGHVLPVASALKRWMDEQRTCGFLDNPSQGNGTIVATQSS